MGFMYSRAPNGARNQIGQSNNLGKMNLLSKLQILELWIFFSMLATFFWACCFAQNAWIWSYKTINYWFLLELEFWIPSQWQLIVHYEVRRVSYSWKSTSIIRFTYMIGYWRRKLILKLPREIQNQIKTITKTALILFLFHVMNSSKICTFWKMVKANVKTIFHAFLQGKVQKQSKNLSSSCSNYLLRKPMCLSFVTTQHTT